MSSVSHVNVLCTFLVSLLVISSIVGSPAHAGTYLNAEANGLNIVTHPAGYDGTGGTLTITVGIDPTSANASSMIVPTQNVLTVINALKTTTGNLKLAGFNNVGSFQYDFESVLLHEMGHALGLDHVNLGTESGQLGSKRDYTKSRKGGDNKYDLNSGTDAVVGTADDLRDDDVNLYWFDKASNNPLATLPAIIDITTYSRTLADLPGADTFPANTHRDASTALGFANTEGIMQEGTFIDEAQRTMTAEGIASLRLAMSGLDETQGTSDDYTIKLSYAGLTASADIVIDFDNSKTDFADTLYTVNNTDLGSGIHYYITASPIYFNSADWDWFFNPIDISYDPDNVYVDFSAGTNGFGRANSPFNNLIDAMDAANEGATIHIEPGTSSETFTGGAIISKYLTLQNENSGSGSVFIGSP